MDTKLDHICYYLVIFCYGLSLCGCQDTFYFNMKPQDQDVIAGRETMLFCDVSNRKHITFQWMHNGKPFENTSRRFQEGSNLRILRVNSEDDTGTFQCIATNVTTGFSLQSNEATLNIQWIDSKAVVELKRPNPDEVAFGSDLLLKCQITGNPEPLFHWYQNQFRIFNTDNIKLLDRATKLRITGIQAKDNGLYSCRAENVAGAVDSTENFLLNIPAPGTPHLIEDLFTPFQLVLKNEEARLDCPFINATRIDWFSKYEKLANSSRHTIYNNGSLSFPRVRTADEGVYRCEGLPANRDIPAQTFTAELALASLDDFSMDSFEPRLISNFPMVVPVHERFEVKVFPPDGKPTPRYRWLDRNDMLVGDSGPIHMEGQNLIFENPQEIDSGNYTFIMNNMAGEKRQNVWIIVSVPPIIRRPPISDQVEEGLEKEFTCQVTGTTYPVTTILWTKDNHFIRPGSRRHQMDLMRGTLRITNLTRGDQGYYTCVANTTGQELVSSTTAYLKIRKKLKFDPLPSDTMLEVNTIAEVQCHADSEDKPIIRWLKDGKVNFAPHVTDSDGTLIFNKVQRSDRGLYTCAARSAEKFINKTIFIDVVERPYFQTKPKNTTAYEGHAVMLHCFAVGHPKPNVFWRKNAFDNSWDYNRFTFLPNGTMRISHVYMQDKGRYECTANNTAGMNHTYADLHVTSGSPDRDREEEESFDMMKTIIIAVCSAGAYLALVIGMTAFCSYRLIIQKRNRKAIAKNLNGNANHEQHELLMKSGDRDSGGTQCKSDSDNRSHASGMSSSQPSHTSQSHSQSLSQSRSRKGSMDKHCFPRQDLQTLGLLGKGQFGDILLAKARNIRPQEQETLVVVKALLTKEEHMFFEFRQEADMYARLDHPNVIKLLGVCRDAEPHFMILEHCDWGDLKQFLIASRTDNGRRVPRVPPVTVVQKLGMCNQVATGMEHLSNHRCVHRDLAARNVLLTSRFELKVSSMALSRDVYMGEYIPHKNSLIPLRWLSPEAVLEDEYSTKSDIWAYGVFVWEVFHLGDLPHKTRTDDELLKGLKVGDVTLEISEQCPNEIVDLIRKCTAESPRDRPQFTDIVNLLGEMLSMLSVSSYPNSVPSANSYSTSLGSYPSSQMNNYPS